MSRNPIVELWILYAVSVSFIFVRTYARIVAVRLIYSAQCTLSYSYSTAAYSLANNRMSDTLKLCVIFFYMRLTNRLKRYSIRIRVAIALILSTIYIRISDIRLIIVLNTYISLIRCNTSLIVILHNCTILTY
ncbi:hypothetical protein HBH42_226490 [Parastagonospora nodorum]|nr:hypothetical protein HBH42_226490 [Parastagonospora nodorum]